MSTSSTQFISLLLGAVADQEAGRLTEAATGFERVLVLEPDQPQALLFGGVLALRMGQVDRAAALLERTVAVRPTLPEAHFAYGNALWAAKRRSDARVAWQHAIRLEPGHVGALLNLAQAQEQSGEAELAVVNCRAAIQARPDHPHSWTVLSNTLRTLGDMPGALNAAETALRLGPALAAAHHQRGMALKSLGRSHDAIAALRQALERDPGLAPSHLNLANLLHDVGDLAGAERHCRAALALDPTMAEAHTVLGFLLIQTGDLPGAIAACTDAISLSPALSEAHCNLGIALLSAGDLPNGFARYEWRKRHPLYAKEFFSLPSPEWLGQPLDGKRIAIMAEQGLGDAIMFARYARVLADCGASVVIACDRRLVSLLDGADGVTEAVAKSRTLPSFDYWVDQMSLPLLCRTTADTVPSPGPYLTADPVRTATWHSRLGPANGRRRVGLVWAGNPLHTNDVNRSCSPDLFRAIADRRDIQPISLQVGLSASRASDIGLVDWSADLVDYAETAALIATLDLVIAVDTSVAHLAAALGKPTWILLPHCAEWRWMQHRIDTPWYDCVRLFRQPHAGDWKTVMHSVLHALSPPA